MSRILATASAALAAGLVFAPSAFAFDCAKAATPVEKAICDDPALKAADDAMGAAYADVARRVSAEQKPMLKGNQLAWLKRRDEMCMWQDGPARTECLLNETNQRADFLRAKPASGPGLRTAMTPWFYSRAQTKTECSAEVAVYKFGDAAKGEGEKGFDAWVKATLEGMETENGERVVEPGFEYDCSYDASMVVTYASPDLIAAKIPSYMYGGGAHGNSNEVAIAVDLKEGAILSYADVFKAGATPKLIEACTADILREKIERFTDTSDPGSAAEVEAQAREDLKTNAEALSQGVGDFANWQIYDDRAEIYFPPYSLGSYAEGYYVCTLPKALLAEAAGPKGWIVP